MASRCYVALLGSTRLSATVLILLSATRVATQEAVPWRDPSPHKAQFITVDKDVRLEVLDWRGSGRPIVLLSGLGDTAHVFDEFAPKLAADFHVYGITRRGYGASTIAKTGYAADRLGDDVLAVLDALHLIRPVLAGHSIAGEELSSIATRRPERIAGFIYLDAGYNYAYSTEQAEESQRFSRRAPQPPEPGPEALETFSALGAWYKQVRGIAMPEAELRQCCDPDTSPSGNQRTPANVTQAIWAGSRTYGSFRAPVLAIYAAPHGLGAWARNNAAARAYTTGEEPVIEAVVKAFESGFPDARVVRLPHANHYVFLSNERDVLREMRQFIASLP
jgi:non-heme chloroperoxidase